MQAMEKNSDNPIGILNVAFLEFTLPLTGDSKENPLIKNLFYNNFAFQPIASHKEQHIELYRQGEIDFIINYVDKSFSRAFSAKHGPSVCGMGLKTIDAKKAFDEAVKRGAKPFKDTKYNSYGFPTVYGIGDSLIYFVDANSLSYLYENQFKENKLALTKNFGLKENRSPHK